METSIERGKSLTKESTFEENQQDPMVMVLKSRQETPIILGKTILMIGDAMVEVEKGMVTLDVVRKKMF